MGSPVFVNTAWAASNIAAFALFLHLRRRGILPWFRAFLAVMVAQTVVLTPLDRHSFAYGITWIILECLLIILEGAAVLELTSLLLQGRLNATLVTLRWFGLAIAVACFGLAAIPLLRDAGVGWAGLMPFLLQGRGYLSLGILLFLAVVWRILAGQPVPIAGGVIRHGQLLAINFGILATEMFVASYFPKEAAVSIYTVSLLLDLALFSLWTLALWKSAMSLPREVLDAALAAEATRKYREFGEKVGALKDPGESE